MKKFMKSIQMMAALLLAVAATTACSNDDNAIDETTPATTGAPKTYTLTVTASKGGEATTRALSIDRKGALNAKWTEGDLVTVQENLEDDGSGASRVPTKYGTLTATAVSSDGYSCTLTGELTGVFSKGQELMLIYNGGSAGSDGTKGTLNYVAKNDDRATAVVSITGVTANSDGTQTLKTKPATFENQQAIVRFTLRDGDGDGAKPISPTALSVKREGGGGSRTLRDIPADTYDDNGEGVLYTGFPGGSGTIVLEATLADGTHRYYQKTDVKLENGKYYTIDVNMKKGTVDLSALTTDYMAKNGDILYGTLPEDIRLSIARNAEVTLHDVTTQEGTTGVPYPGIECIGSATINLMGTNQVEGNFSAGISVPKDETLTIQGGGTVTAKGSSDGAGIGGKAEVSCGNIIISGGTVTATSSDGGAGIGSGKEGSCGNITISGGTVTAMSSDGGASGAGIGSGFKASCGNITISGGNVTATGSGGGAGIGSGKEGSCGKITISGGTVTATSNKGAGIGSGHKASCGNITISGGTVSATGGGNGAGIGSCFKASCGKITITDKVTSVTAVKGKDAKYSIGPGNSGTCGKVTIGGKVYYDGADFQNEECEDYLKDSPLVYEPEKETESNQQ